MRPKISLRKALADKYLLGKMLAGDSWQAWRTLLIAAMGEQLTTDERILFTKFTGREREPLQRVAELTGIVGRRGGKSSAIASGASYIAGLCDHSDVLAAGEKGVLLCVAADTRQARIILDYCEAAFEQSPMLKQMIAARTADALELTNGISIEVRPASFRRLRGPTYIAVVADELSFWYADSSYANPDAEILAAVRPGLLTTRGPLFLISSAYAKKGVLWETYRKHYGPDGAPLILVAKGTSRDFNPTLPQAEIDRALEADRARNSAEYLSEFGPTSRASLHSKWSRAVSATIARCCLPPARATMLSSTHPAAARTASLLLLRTGLMNRSSSTLSGRRIRRFPLSMWSRISVRCSRATRSIASAATVMPANFRVSCFASTA